MTLNVLLFLECSGNISNRCNFTTVHRRPQAGTRGAIAIPRNILESKYCHPSYTCKWCKNTLISTLNFLSHSPTPLYWTELWRNSTDHTSSALRCFAPRYRPSVTRLSLILVPHQNFLRAVMQPAASSGMG